MGELMGMIRGLVEASARRHVLRFDRDAGESMAVAWQAFRRTYPRLPSGAVSDLVERHAAVRVAQGRVSL